MSNDGVEAGAGPLVRYRRKPHYAESPARRVAAQRDLAQVTHIPGDLSVEQIDRRFYAALAVIRWRRGAERSA